MSRRPKPRSARNNRGRPQGADTKGRQRSPRSDPERKDASSRDRHVSAASRTAKAIGRASERINTPPDAIELQSLKGSWKSRPEYRSLTIDDIIIDPVVSPRIKLGEDIVESIAEALEEGARVPPLVVFSTGTTIVLADGHRRLEALRRYGAAQVEVEQRSGSIQDAKFYAVYVNVRHGKNLSREEVRGAITKCFDDPASHTWTNAEIAELCGCSPPTVAKVRGEHPLTQKLLSGDFREVRRNGSRVRVDVSRTGRRAGRPGDRTRERSKRAVIADTPTPTVSAPTEEGDEVTRFLGGLEEAMSDWDTPEELGDALSSATGRSLHLRIGTVLDWCDAVITRYRSSEEVDDAFDQGEAGEELTDSDWG